MSDGWRERFQAFMALSPVERHEILRFGMTKLHTQEGGRLSFWCPGCDDDHTITIEPGRWTFNGDADRPTFQPSVLVRSGHYAQQGESAKRGTCWCTYNAEHPNDPAPFKCYRCHSFVTDGQIQFLSDCTHELAGKTVPLPDWRD